MLKTKTYGQFTMLAFQLIMKWVENCPLKFDFKWTIFIRESVSILLFLAYTKHIELLF